MSGRGAFNEFAERLVANGFTVTAARGKAPLVPRWQNPRPTNIDFLRKVLRSNRYPDCNIGIVCGRVVAIDLDSEIAAENDRLKLLAHELIGPTRFERIGRAPRTLLLYRPAEGEVIPSCRVGSIDVLAGGKQFIAYGFHPHTGQPYRWSDRHCNPATANINEVPIVTAAALASFLDAIRAGSSPKPIAAARLRVGVSSLKSRQRARQGDMLRSQYDARIVRDADGRVVDGREAFMAKLTASEFAKRTHRTPDELGTRVWARFIAEIDVARPKGSNPRQRWSLKDALTKARATCRRNPDLKPPRRSRGGHPASHLHAWRRPGFWTAAQRELHLAEVGRRICTPATLAVGRVMIAAVDLASGFCTMSIAEIAKLAGCSPKSVKTARATLRNSGLWIAGPGGVFVPLGGQLNRNQATEKKRRKQVGGTTRVPSLYHLSVVSCPPSTPSQSASTAITTSRRPYQPNLFGAPVVDLDQYRRGLMPSDVAASVRAEMRARGVTQDVLAANLGISQPQLANALAGRFGLSPEPAARLLAWLGKVA
jgi:Bifunctional DNA primase/polymerase, N-terminal